VSSPEVKRQVYATAMGNDYYLVVKPPFSREELDRLPTPSVEVLVGYEEHPVKEVEENGSQVLGYHFSQYDQYKEGAFKTFLGQIAETMTNTLVNTEIYKGMNPEHVFGEIDDVPASSRYL